MTSERTKSLYGTFLKQKSNQPGLGSAVCGERVFLRAVRAGRREPHLTPDSHMQGWGHFPGQRALNPLDRVGVNGKQPV